MKIIIFSIFVFSTAGYSREIAIDELSQLVKTSNFLIKASDYDLKSTQALDGHLKRSFTPNVNLIGGYEDFTLDNLATNKTQSSAYGFIQAQVNLYNRGNDLFHDQFVNEQITQDSIELRQQAFYQELKATELYWQIIGYQNNLDLFSDYQKTLQALFKKAQSLVVNRIATKSDEILLQIQLSKSEMILKKMLIDLDEAKNQFALILGLDEHKHLSFISDFPRSFPSSVMNAPVSDNNLEIDKIKSQLTMTDLSKNEFNNWWHPTIDLYSEYGRPAPSDEFEMSLLKQNEFAVGIRFNFSFGEVTKISSLSDSMKFQQSALDFRLKHTKKKLASIHHELIHDVKLLSEMIIVGKETMDLIQERNRILNLEFDRGVARPSDLLSLAQERYEIAKMIVDSKVEYLQKSSQLDFLFKR